MQARNHLVEGGFFWLTGTEVSVCLGKEGMAPQEPISEQPEKIAVREGGKRRREVGGKRRGEKREYDCELSYLIWALENCHVYLGWTSTHIANPGKTLSDTPRDTLN